MNIFNIELNKNALLYTSLLSGIVFLFVFMERVFGWF